MDSHAESHQFPEIKRHVLHRLQFTGALPPILNGSAAGTANKKQKTPSTNLLIHNSFSFIIGQKQLLDSIDPGRVPLCK